MHRGTYGGSSSVAKGPIEFINSIGGHAYKVSAVAYTDSGESEAWSAAANGYMLSEIGKAEAAVGAGGQRETIQLKCRKHGCIFIGCDETQRCVVTCVVDGYENLIVGSELNGTPIQPALIILA